MKRLFRNVTEELPLELQIAILVIGLAISIWVYRKASLKGDDTFLGSSPHIVFLALATLFIFITRLCTGFGKKRPRQTLFSRLFRANDTAKKTLGGRLRPGQAPKILPEPLILKAFFDSRISFFVHTVTVLLLGFIVPNNFEYIFLNIIAGIVTILSVSDLYKRANLFIAVTQITVVYIAAYFSFFVIHEGSIDLIKIENFGFFILGGLGTLFVHPLIYIYEKLFGLVSDVSLLELTDTNSKLLKLLSEKAPGTFNHSLSVANLAEAAANEVNANSLLARVGALYHDIGKMNNPLYFSENQLTGKNPHNELTSKESVDIILNHVINGIEIARKYNIPDRVIDFIRTHHGTSLVYYFYEKDSKLEVKPNKEDYMYSGPKPFSKETAIVMMCDGVEAASKSLKNPDFNKINDFVNMIIGRQISSDQFINANITFKEIEIIKKVLINKLINIFHIRIEYPQ